jgi:PAS domain S-box-containing protein|uniref:histidine kinase n=1 Tax=Desulfobacca acetoxidans TaxID=60893 RepID=A0A7C3WGK7_9BACT
MRRFTFFMSKYALLVLLALNLILLGAGIYLGLKSAKQMQEIVRDDFNQQQLVLARHIASMLKQDIQFLERELTTANLSPSVQYLEPLTWANRLRFTLSSVREEGVVEIFRINAPGTRKHLVDERGLDHVFTGSFHEEEYFLWASRPENKGRVYIGRVSTQVPNHLGRLILTMVVPTYEVSVDETHPHPSGEFGGVLGFHIDAHYLASKFTRGIKSGKTGYAWIMDNQGIFLSHPEKEFIGQNAFVVRKQRMPAISFDAINEIQREKMLTGQEGWGTYISGWHGGLAGEMQKLIAYTPVHLGDLALGKPEKGVTSWSVAVVAPEEEVLGVVHSLYFRQFLLQGIIGFFVLSGTIFLLNFRYERQLSATLEEEIHRIREELQKSEARYQALVENAADLIYMVDEQGRILSLNKFAADFFSYALASSAGETKPSDFIGRNFYEIFSRDSARFHMDWLKEVKETGQAKAKRHPVTIGEHEFWFSTIIVGLKDEQGNTYAYEIISRNITGRKAFEERMINMEKLAALGTLAAGVAHEINNPIAVILGFTEHLLEKADGLPEIKETLQVIEEEGLKCKKIVENLLTFARAPERAEITADVNQILEKMLSVVGNTLLTKKIRLEAHLAPDLPRVKGDPRELQQVFINMVQNAMDSMKGGGALKVSTRLAPDGKRVTIEFSDTGCGIPREAQPRIFDPFFTTKKTGEGTGLGLSVSYGIVTKYGGNIIFSSFPADEYPDKHGTTFKIYLPAVPKVEAEAGETAVTEEQEPAPLSLL